MNRFEEYDLYVRNKDFLVSDQIIAFSDRSGRLLALKPDVTLSIVKNAPQERGVVQKVYYNENVYRDYREIMQAGLECVGDLGDYEIAEVVLLAAMSLEKLGRPFVLDLSHMGLVSAVLDGCGLTGSDRIRAMDCLKRKSPHELSQLGEEAERKLGLLIRCRGTGTAVLPQLKEALTGEAECAALSELESLWAILENAGLAQAVRLDFSVSSDMRYYSGVVFKGYLEGIPTSVLSGGQYDRLLQRMKRRSRAIGFAIYVDLLSQLEKGSDGFDLDTLILHDGTVSTEKLMEAAQAAAKEGSVLVARQAPSGRRWRKLIRFEKGEASQ